MLAKKPRYGGELQLAVEHHQQYHQSRAGLTGVVLQLSDPSDPNIRAPSTSSHRLVQFEAFVLRALFLQVHVLENPGKKLPSMSFCHHQSVRSGIVWRHRSIAGCTANGVSLVLPIVRRRPNTKTLHLVKQGGALQAESGGCSSRTSELPIGTLASNEDLSTHLIFQRRSQSLAPATRISRVALVQRCHHWRE